MREAENTPPPPSYGGGNAPFPCCGAPHASVAAAAGGNDKRKRSFASTLCSLNFLLCIMGYPLVMAVLAPLGVDLEAGENVYFTYPYRIFQMLVAGLALFSVRSNPLPKFSWKFLLLMLFWVMYLYRSYWSMFVDVPPILRSELWRMRLYVVIDVFPLLAVVKGWNKIDFRRVLKWALVLGGLGLLFSVRNIAIQAEESWKDNLGRVAATRMLHTQALGGFGASLIILSLYMFFVDGWKKILWQGFSVAVALLAAYVMLKAGSRGPLLAVAFAGTLWFGIRRKNLLLVLLLWAIAAGTLLLFKDQIVAIINEISPTMASRLSSTLDSGDTSGRDVLWAECWQMCKQYPLFGYSHTAFGYPHNMFLDGLMMFGMIGGWIITILIFISLFTALKYLHTARGCYWWALFVLTGLSQSFTQSGFNGTGLQATLLILFIWEEYRQNARFRVATPPAFPRTPRFRPAGTASAETAAQPDAQIFSLDETVPASENHPKPTASK